MLLLVSVRNASEASSALAGGADIIDAKEPTAGALGAVTITTFRDIHGAVCGRRPVSAAIGDADEDDAIERQAQAFANAGAEFIKLGISGVASPTRARSLVTTSLRASRATIAVAYADWSGGISPDAVLDIAAETGARGVLLDTADKHGPGLSALMDHRSLTAWVGRARSAGLLVALAGKLTRNDLACACDAGADIVGVRGAACSGGRNGTITEAKVRELADIIAASAKATAAKPPERHYT